MLGSLHVHRVNAFFGTMATEEDQKSLKNLKSGDQAANEDGSAEHLKRSRAGYMANLTKLYKQCEVIIKREIKRKSRQ